MHSIALYTLLLASLLPTVISRKGGGGGHGGSSSGGSSSSANVHFKPPPFVIAVLASDAVFFLLTAVQLSITNAPKRLSRMPSGHRHSIAAIISTLTLLGVAYALAVTLTATTWALDDTGYPSVGYKNNVNINIAAALFWGWVDALMFVAVTVILRDRYLACAGKATAEKTSRVGPPPLFVVGSSIVFLLVFVFVIAHVGVWGSAILGLYNRTLSLTQADNKIVTSNGLFYTFLGMLLISAVFLLAFAVVVRRHNRSDKIAMLTLKVVVPIFILYAVARIVVTIVEVQLAKSSLYTAEDEQIFYLTNHAMYGVFHIAVTAVLVYFLTVPHLWEPSFSQPSFVTPAATPQPHFHGGLPPVQFDGHPEFTAHPQQYGGPQLHPSYLPDDRYSQGSNFDPYPGPQVAPLRASYHGEDVGVRMPLLHSQ